MIILDQSNLVNYHADQSAQSYHTYIKIKMRHMHYHVGHVGIDISLINKLRNTYGNIHSVSFQLSFLITYSH